MDIQEILRKYQMVNFYTDDLKITVDKTKNENIFNVFIFERISEKCLWYFEQSFWMVYANLDTLQPNDFYVLTE